jgi:hypothetical protein
MQKIGNCPYFSPIPESSFRWISVASIVLAGFIAYANSFRNDFVWDDVSSVLLHKHVQDPSQFFQLFREDQHAFGRGQGNFYRPLVSVSFMIDFLLSHGQRGQAVTGPGIPNLSPFVFHLTNTSWHVAATILLFALLTRLKAPALVRFAVPILYVVHPLHTEAVTYISGRADSMSAAFIYAGLWCSLGKVGTVTHFLPHSLRLGQGTQTQKIGNCPHFSQRMLAYILGMLCFVGGLLCKESATIFPFMLLLFILLKPVEEPDRKKAYLNRLIPFGVSLVILAAYAYLRITILRFANAAATPPSTFGHRLIETCQAFALYLKLIFVPTHLHMERTLADATGWTALAGAILLLLSMGLLVESVAHNRRRMALGIGWFLLTWLPISGLFPLNAPMAEHWLYVPLAGLLWALAEVKVGTVTHFLPVSLRLGRGTQVQKMGYCPYFYWVWFIALIALTVARNPAWRDNETIFRDTLAKNPNSARVHYNLAVTYEDILKNLPGAKRHYGDVIEIYKKQKKAAGREAYYDDELEAYNSLGKIYLQQGDYQAAAEQYRTVLSVGGSEKNAALLASSAFGLGKCFLAMGDLQRAGELFKRAVALDPSLKGEVQRWVTALPATS